MTETFILTDRDRVKALSLSSAIAELTPDGTIMEVNELFLRLTGYRRDDVIGKQHHIFLRYDYANSPEYNDFQRQLGLADSFTQEFEYITSSGRPIWVSGHYMPLVDSSGKVTGIMSLVTEITHRKAAVADLVEALDRLADGKLNQGLAMDTSGEFSGVYNSFNRVIGHFSTMVTDIRQRTVRLYQEAEQIAQGANDLARRGEGQAAALEETGAAIEQISGNTSMTSSAAQEANNAAQEAEKVVTHGNHVVVDAVAAIERIEQHTKSMGEFTRVIENFAFQTNLLSINAAVEAARAGEVGRGFAVVAQEVRNLAQQSGKASQSIAELIGKSEAEVQSGVELVRQTGSALNDIQTAVRGVVNNISGIAHATAEQATGVREVSSALSHLDSDNQANLSMSEHYATAAASLSSQIDELTTMLKNFETDPSLIVNTSPSIMRVA